MKLGPFVALVMIALGLRLIVAIIVGQVDFSPSVDAGAYRQIADNLLARRGFLSVSEWGTFRAFYSPLYPLLLAGLGQALNPLIDLATAITIVGLGARLGDVRTGRLAAVLWLFWPVAILFTPVAQKDTLAIFLVSQIALAVLSLRVEVSRGAIIWLGSVTGLLALTQPAFVTFAPIAVLLLKRDVRVMAGAASVAALVSLPWWIRNWLMFGHFVPLTTAGGFSLLVSVTGSYSAMKPFTAMGEIKGSNEALHAALNLAAAHPLQTLVHRVGSAVRAVALESYVPTVYRAGLYNGMDQFTLALQAYWIALLGAAAAGIKRVPGELMLLFVAALLQFALFNFWFEFGERHRYMIVPFVALAAAYGISFVRDRLSQREG